jgi:hypothetical protein
MSFMGSPAIRWDKCGHINANVAAEKTEALSCGWFPETEQGFRIL